MVTEVFQIWRIAPWHLIGAHQILDEEGRGRSHPEPLLMGPTDLPEHVPSMLSSLEGDIRSWLLWDPSPGSLWGAISGCPTENPVIGGRMGPSKASNTGDQREGLFPFPKTAKGTFSNLAQEGRVSSQHDRGEPGSPAAWPGIHLSPFALSQGQVKEKID